MWLHTLRGTGCLALSHPYRWTHLQFLVCLYLRRSLQLYWLSPGFDACMLLFPTILKAANFCRMNDAWASSHCDNLSILTPRKRVTVHGMRHAASVFQVPMCGCVALHLMWYIWCDWHHRWLMARHYQYWRIRRGRWWGVWAKADVGFIME